MTQWQPRSGPGTSGADIVISTTVSVGCPVEARDGFTHPLRSTPGPDAAVRAEKKGRLAANMVTLSPVGKKERKYEASWTDREQKCRTVLWVVTQIHVHKKPEQKFFFPSVRVFLYTFLSRCRPPWG